MNVAQFLVGGLTLPLVAKFAGADHNKQRGWAITMGIWAILCLVCFLVTFATTKERIQPVVGTFGLPVPLFGFLVLRSEVRRHDVASPAVRVSRHGNSRSRGGWHATGV